MRRLSFEPLVPPALWLALAVIAAALLLWYGWRRPAAVRGRRWVAVLALMAAGLALVLGILLNPIWAEPVKPPAGKPLLTILVDATASMATADAGEARTRYQSAVRLARACATELADRFEVRVATFAGSPRPAELADLDWRQPDGPVTDLAAAVTGSLEENRPQGQVILLFSDGIHNAGGGSTRVLDTVRLARALACPVYTRTFGGEAAIKDVAVELRSAREVAYLGQKVPVTALIRQRGLRGARVNVALAYGNKELERRQVLLASADAAEVRFQVARNGTGVYRYEVRAEPVPGEVSLVNNTAIFVLRVVDQPVRILLLEGKPYWDTKFLVRTLAADPSVELDSVVRVGENRFVRRTWSRTRGGQKPPVRRAPAAPAPVHEEWKVLAGLSAVASDLESLRSYQVVVLGRDAELFLTEPMLTRLRNWMARDGGCLVCCRGQPMNPVNQRLGQLLPLRWTPVRESRFRVSLTERGRDLHWLAATGPEAPGEALSDLPALATAARAEHPKPLAVVLATARAQAGAPEDPVVTYQPYGAGRAVIIEGAGMWRWAFLPPAQQRHDEVYRSLWHGLLRWLVSSVDLLPGQKLALRSDKITFGTTEAAAATLLLRDDLATGPVPRVGLFADGVKQQTITPVPVGDESGTFRVRFGQLPEGRYEARVAVASPGDAPVSTAFDVRSLFEEQLDLKARPDLMARIAAESGGAILDAATPPEVVKQLQEHLDRGKAQQVRRVSAWDRWWVLAGVILVFGAGWTTRRSGGLV
ncbi:MAG TPA: vWA domain-containing protein [Gemmataceae bacterium]|jgi:hypothetical protein|nr:vWA domain-containing protein [Gemmataceae bacterium]